MSALFRGSSVVQIANLLLMGFFLTFDLNSFHMHLRGCTQMASFILRNFDSF